MDTKIIATAVKGAAHEYNGIECQDFVYYEKHNGFSCIALSDGAGSARLSHIGAEYTAKSAVKTMYMLCEKYKDGLFDHLDSIVSELFNTILGGIDKFVGNKADYACTLLVVCIYDDKYICIHVGDGIIISINNNNAEIISLPENGDSPNITYFITDDNYLNHIRVKHGQITPNMSFLLSSDGCSNKLYNPTDGSIAEAVLIMNSWLNEFDENNAEKLLLDNLVSVIKPMVTDDISIGLINVGQNSSII